MSLTELGLQSRSIMVSAMDEEVCHGQCNGNG